MYLPGAYVLDVGLAE